MNSNIDQLVNLPYVRRVVQSEGVVGALTDDSIGVNDNPTELTANAAFHAPLSVVGAADCEVLWDRAAEDLRQQLSDVPGVLGIAHRWCGEDEKVEVEVGRNHNNGEGLRFSLKETVERAAFPEGVYAIVVAPQPGDAVSAQTAYEESFSSAYATERRRLFDAEKSEIIQAAREECYGEKPRNMTHAAEQEARFKELVAERTKELVAAAAASDTQEALLAFIKKAKRLETADEKEQYLAGATRAACVERVTLKLDGLFANEPWGIEILHEDELDERYTRFVW